VLDQLEQIVADQSIGLHDLLHEHARAKAVEELGSTAMR
jgi:hypothetical protein